MDPKIVSMLMTANEAEAEQKRKAEAAMSTAQGMAMALGQLPVFERVELVGALEADILHDDMTRITCRGIGHARSYSLVIPGDWLRSVIAELDTAKANAEGEAVPSGDG